MNERQNTVYVIIERRGALRLDYLGNYTLRTGVISTEYMGYVRTKEIAQAKVESLQAKADEWQATKRNHKYTEFAYEMLVAL